MEDIRILFTMTPKPYRPLVDYAHPFDLFGGRLSAFQGLFTMHSINRPVALHLLAQNVPFPSKVIEFPSVEEIQAEIRKEYEYIAIQVHSNMEFPTVMEMCRWIRDWSPETKIILGGHGVTCYTEEFLKREEIEGLADHVCWGEGVEFIRELFGTEEPVDPILPPMEFFLEMMPEKVNRAGVIVPGVGCTNRCSFCATGHFFGGRFIPLQNAAGMYRVMEKTRLFDRSVDRFALFDELFLSRPDEVRELGELLYHGGETNLSNAGYFTFSDFRSIVQYDPDDLLRWGVSRVFLGVESTTRPLAKTRGIDLKGVVDRLHAHGIETILSMIFGLAHHDRENIRTEQENFIALDGVYNQITLESPIVGTPNWKVFKLQGRIDNSFDIQDLHGYSKAYSHPNFEKGETLEIAKAFQKRIYREKGPGILKAIEVELNGFERCARHPDAVLRNHKASYFARSLRNQAPILCVIRERAEEPAVRERAVGVIDRYLGRFGAEDPHFKRKGERLVRRYDKELAKRTGPNGLKAPYFAMDTVETYYEGVQSGCLEPVCV
ncbi:MAG: cobalamin B12-binding domain-containing protein [Candidatus Omnitrophica bacterium]|nr:hypothetical protein [bacterium]NUN97212.1 cobalamin B12-binding domain-containing protein [Candidatus Omnitrophota bacterium]